MLDGIEAFLRVAERKSFTYAARDLGVSPSAISQAIRSLELKVGVALFMRTTRSVGLTQAGELFLEHVSPAYAGLFNAYEMARNLGGRPAGRLRINLMRAAVQPLFEPILAGFCETYPEIELELYADDALADLSSGGFDAGIRFGEAVEADMIAIRLSQSFPFVVAAAPRYIEKYGIAETPEDLRHHHCVRTRNAAGAIVPWNFQRGDRLFELMVKGPVIVNDVHAVMVAVRSGIAMGRLAGPTAEPLVKRGELQLLLRPYEVSTSGLFLYYPSRQQLMPKLRAFIDYVRDYLPSPLTVALPY